MKRKTIVSFILMAAFIGATQLRTASADQLGDKLQLAPQSEGPSLEETLKWIKQKVDSLHGFNHWNTGGGVRKVDYTSFDIDSNYIMTIKQKIAGFHRTGDPYISMKHFVCDMKGLSGVETYGRTTVDLSFHKPCKIYDGEGDGTGEHCEFCYPKEPPFLNRGHDFDTGDPEMAEKLAKAFNHAAKLFEKMPKKRSDDLF